MRAVQKAVTGPQAGGLERCCAMRTAPRLGETQGQAAIRGDRLVSWQRHTRLTGGPVGAATGLGVWSSGLNQVDSHPELSVTISSQAGKGDRGQSVQMRRRRKAPAALAPTHCSALTFYWNPIPTHRSSYLAGTEITRCHMLPSGGGRSSSRDQMFRSVHA